MCVRAYMRACVRACACVCVCACACVCMTSMPLVTTVYIYSIIGILMDMYSFVTRFL